MLKKTLQKKATHILTGLGIALTSFLLVLGVFLGSIAVVKMIRAFIEARIDAVVIQAEQEIYKNNKSESGRVSSPSSPLLSSSSVPLQEELIFASFSDLFSSVAALDSAKTTMYRDDVATAFMFPPKLVWTESKAVGLPNIENMCIQSTCLTVKGTVLTKDGVVVALPTPAFVNTSAGTVETVSVDVVGNEWMVGIVQKENGKYAGYAYRFDGKTFTAVFPSGKAFESDYKGVWGFGGTPDDFLAIYGAYQGKGYRVRHLSSSLSSVIVDLSWLFDVRIMRGGIMPGIARVGSGTHTAWYLWNKERNNRPVFVKLFQNGTENIIGEADLLGTAPQSFSYFALNQSKAVGLPKVENFPYSLAGYSEQNGSASAWSIRDEGFKIPTNPVIVTSANLNNYHAEVPHILKAALREFSDGDAKIALAVSNGGDWEPVGVMSNQSSMINNYWFRDPHRQELKWRMVITPGTNPEYTPFIGILDLDYEVKRLQ